LIINKKKVKKNKNNKLENKEVYTYGSQVWFKRLDTNDDLIHWKELDDKNICQVNCGDNFLVALSSIYILKKGGKNKI
jgi:hypothetical protein